MDLALDLAYVKEQYFLKQIKEIWKTSPYLSTPVLIHPHNLSRNVSKV